MSLVNIALHCYKAEIRVPVVGGDGGGWCKPIFVSNPQPSCFGLLLGWVAVTLLCFAVMTKMLVKPLKIFMSNQFIPSQSGVPDFIPDYASSEQNGLI